MKEPREGTRWNGPAPALAFVIVISIVAGADSRADETCLLDYDWAEGLIEISSNAGGSYDQLACEPIPLVVDASHWVLVDEKCEGCEDTSNKFVEIETNIEYSWVIVDTDGGNLTTVANDDSRMGTTAQGKAVLYHAPDLEDEEELTVEIRVTASNADSDKPVPASVTGTFTITLTGETREETEHFEDVTVVERSDHVLADVTFVGDMIEGPGGTELIFLCDPDVDWEDRDPISGDFWIADKNDPVTALVAGEVVVLTAEGEDRDDMVLQCAGSGGCQDSGETRVDVPDTLSYEWSVDVGSLLLTDRGREVIYVAPVDPAITQVTVSLTITDTMSQYVDPAFGLQKTFPIGSSELTGTAASVHYLADVTHPPATQATPDGSIGEIYHIPYYSLPEQGSGGFNWNYFDIAWDGSTWSMDIGANTVFVHPWRAITGFLDGARQDAPPSTFADYDGFRDWANANVTDVWIAHAADLLAHRRHDVIREIEHVDYDTVTGKLSIRSAPGFELARLWQLRSWSRASHSPIFAHTTIEISGECESVVAVKITSETKLGHTAAQILLDTTNRINRFAHMGLVLNAVAATGGYTAVTPFGSVFPRRVVYHGDDGAPLTIDSDDPGDSVAQWVDDQIPIRSAP